MYFEMFEEILGSKVDDDGGASDDEAKSQSEKGKGKGKGKSGDVSMSGANILVDAHGLARHMLGRLRIPAHEIPCKKTKQEVYRVW